MELSAVSLVFWSCIFSAALLVLLRLIIFSKGSTKPTPPGPSGWPIFGNIFDLGTAAPHQTLYRLRPQYGPVLWLRLGAINTMVVQSANAAAELFKNHDLPFSDRKVPFILTAHNYDQGSIALGRYGPYWRTTRKVCSTEFLVHKRINGMGSLRRKCVDSLIRWIEEEEAAEGRGGEVELPHFLFCMAFNVIGNIILSRDVVDVNSEDGREFFRAMNGVMEWAGTPNLADFFPWLKRLDLQGMMRNMVRDMGQALNIIGRFVKERDEERQSGMVKEKRDFLDVLLECRDDENEGPHKISNHNVNVLVLVTYIQSLFSLLVFMFGTSLL